MIKKEKALKLLLKKKSFNISHDLEARSSIRDPSERLWERATEVQRLSIS